jgi:hypothetical protein
MYGLAAGRYGIFLHHLRLRLRRNILLWITSRFFFGLYEQTIYQLMLLAPVDPGVRDPDEAAYIA